jgi:hypothetical protein
MKRLPRRLVRSSAADYSALLEEEEEGDVRRLSGDATERSVARQILFAISADELSSRTPVS